MSGSRAYESEWHENEVRGVGEAAEGRVHAIVAHGRMLSLELDPRLLRSDPETLADHVIDAVNAALDDLRAALARSAPDLEVDPLALARQLRDVREEVDARMSRLTASIEVSVSELRKEAEVTSAVPEMGFGDLFDQLIDVLETIGGASEGAEGLHGEGQASEESVQVACELGPRLTSVVIRPQALRGAQELSGHVVTAVNAALDDLEEKLRKRRQDAGADSEKIRARIDELRKLGVARMDAYGQGAAELMGGIRPHG